MFIASRKKRVSLLPPSLPPLPLSPSLPLLPSPPSSRYIIDKEEDAINPKQRGTKVAPYYVLEVPPGEERVVKLRLTDAEEKIDGDPFGPEFDEIFLARKEEADDFYEKIIPAQLGTGQKNVSRQAYAGRNNNLVTGSENLTKCLLWRFGNVCSETRLE